MSLIVLDFRSDSNTPLLLFNFILFSGLSELDSAVLLFFTIDNLLSDDEILGEPELEPNFIVFFSKLMHDGGGLRRSPAPFRCSNDVIRPPLLDCLQNNNS